MGVPKALDILVQGEASNFEIWNVQISPPSLGWSLVKTWMRSFDLITCALVMSTLSLSFLYVGWRRSGRRKFFLSLHTGKSPDELRMSPRTSIP